VRGIALEVRFRLDAIEPAAFTRGQTAIASPRDPFRFRRFFPEPSFRSTTDDR
jgi:hypothetical protein